MEVVCLSLSSWLKEEPYPIDADRYNEVLKLAIHDQLSLGWERVLYGIWSNFWVSSQQQHFQALGSKKSALIWFATVQQRLWLLAFAMRDHRNKTLHDNNHSIYPHELEAIDDEITQEMQLGIWNLPISQRYLFHGTAGEKLRWNVSMKIQWITSVRHSRNHFYPLNGLQLPVRQESVTRVLTRWHRKGNVRV